MSKSKTSFQPADEKIIAQTNDILIREARIEVTPKLTIVQPQIKMVDANLAYKYADLQNDASQLTNYFTAFLGISIGALISLIVTFLIERNSISIAIYCTTFLLTTIVTIIFGFLAHHSNTKAQEAKKLLESSAGMATNSS